MPDCFTTSAISRFLTLLTSSRLEVAECDDRLRKATAETPMQNANQGDASQVPPWNGPAGHAWVEMQDLLDQILKPIEDLLLEAAFSQEPKSRIRVLDVGCGPGGTTLAASRRLG